MIDICVSNAQSGAIELSTIFITLCKYRLVCRRRISRLCAWIKCFLKLMSFVVLNTHSNVDLICNSCERIYRRLNFATIVHGTMIDVVGNKWNLMSDNNIEKMEGWGCWECEGKSKWHSIDSLLNRKTFTIYPNTYTTTFFTDMSQRMAWNYFHFNNLKILPEIVQFNSNISLF